MYTRILVATGGSPWSDAALTSAIALAARTDAELHILTVLTVPAFYGTSDRDASVNLVMASIEEAGQDLLEQAADRARRAGVVHTTHYTWGPIPTTILQTAVEEDCDLIVLGARRTAGCQRRKLGSIANIVAAQASQPVLVVKRPLAPDALLGRRILIATGGSPWSDAAVDYALHLARAQELEVCLLHVVPHLADDTAVCAGKQILTQAETRAAAAGVVYEGTLASGPIPEVILETASRKHCRAIIVGSRRVTGWKRLMLGRIVNTVAARAAFPVLVVKHSVPVETTLALDEGWERRLQLAT